MEELDKIRSAIEYIENHVPANIGDCMVEALEKQIPKKPEDDIVMDEEFWSQTPFERKIKVCASCHNIYLRDKQKFCDDCGQAIDWN